MTPSKQIIAKSSHISELFLFIDTYIQTTFIFTSFRVWQGVIQLMLWTHSTITILSNGNLCFGHENAEKETALLPDISLNDSFKLMTVFAIGLIHLKSEVSFQVFEFKLLMISYIKFFRSHVNNGIVASSEINKTRPGITNKNRRTHPIHWSIEILSLRTFEAMNEILLDQGWPNFFHRGPISEIWI